MQTNEFLNNVCEKIKYKPIRNEIYEELKNHIEEQKEAFIQSGIEENIAEEKAIENMGSSEELGKKLNKIHRAKLDWKLVLLILFLIAFGILVTIIRIRNEISLDYRYSRGTHIGKYILALGIGMILSILIYFIDYRKMSKYPMLFYIIATLCFLVGKDRINERIYFYIFSTYIYSIVIAIPLYMIAFVGFIYNINKESKIKITTQSGKNININIIKIIVLSIISLHFVMTQSIATAFILGLVYMIISTIKLSKLEKKGIKYIAILWGIPLILLSSVMLIYVVNNFGEYRITRLIVSFYPEIDPNGSGWEAMNRNEIIKSAKLFGGIEGNDLEYKPWFEQGEAWAFISILANYGWGVALGMLLAIILLSLKLIINAGNIKEEYGKWLIIGISTIFILESLLNIAMNLGFGIIASFNLPLISYGLTSLIMDMMSLALVLSVYRRKDINICETKYENTV